jgi:hypothetical protein
VASLAHVPAELRDTASGVPEDVRNRLQPEELRLRCREVKRIRDLTPVTGPATSEMLSHARRLLRAWPVREFLDRREELHSMASAMPSGIDSPAHDLRRAASELKEQHVYPAGLVNACEARLNGWSAYYEDSAGNRVDLDALLGLDKQQRSWSD